MMMFYGVGGVCLTGLVLITVGLRLSSEWPRRIVSIIGGLIVAFGFGYGVGLVGLTTLEEMSNAGMAAIAIPGLIGALFAGGGLTWTVFELVMRSGRGHLMSWPLAAGGAGALLGGLILLRYASDGAPPDSFSIMIVLGLFAVLVGLHFVLTLLEGRASERQPAA